MHKEKPCLHIFKLREYWRVFLEVSCYKSRCLQHKLQGEFVYFLFACRPWFLFVERWTRTYYFHEVLLFIWNICISNTVFIKIVQSTFETSVYGAYKTKYKENKCWHFRQNESSFPYTTIWGYRSHSRNNSKQYKSELLETILHRSNPHAIWQPESWR